MRRCIRHVMPGMRACLSGDSAVNRTRMNCFRLDHYEQEPQADERRYRSFEAREHALNLTGSG
jgi:hypothetical protein